MSNEATKELEGEIGSASQAPDNQRVAMPTAGASDLPLLIVSGANSPRSRIGRGLESIGGMTAETLQRISTAVGGVVKSPVVLMAKVGGKSGLASPRAATLTAPPGSSLEERVLHLETQMKSFEERFNSRTIVTELDLSPCLHKEKPRIAKSLLQEMEMEETVVKRVQMLEDRVNERMEKIAKALSNIQSQLDGVEFSRHESVAGYERPESLSGEHQYSDAEQQSDNFEALEGVKENFFGAHDVLGEATAGSPMFEKSRVKETSSAALTTAEHVEPLQDIDVGKNDDFLDPQVVSTPVYSKEAFLTQSMKSVAPRSELVKSAQKDDAGKLPAFSDRQLASTLEELHGSYVTESSAAATSAKFLEIARAVTAEKSTLAEAFPGEPSTTVPGAESEEHAQADVADKCGTTIAVVELLLPPTFEASQKDLMKEPLAVAPNANLAQELASQGVVIIALASAESLVPSKSVEEPLVAVPDADSEVPTHADTGDKNVTMTAVGESPAFQDPQEDSVTEALVGAPSAGLVDEPSSQEDLSTASETALASSESPAASKSVEEPSAATPSANFQEPAQEDAVNKNGNTTAAEELPLASPVEEPEEEESVKKFMAAAPSADLDEVAQEDVAEKTGTAMAAKELSMAASFEELQEGFEKESMASAPSGELAQEHGDMAVESSETEEASTAALSADFGEGSHKVDGTIIPSAESPLVSSFDNPRDDFDKESLAAAPSAKPAQELATQEDTSIALAAPETVVKPKFAEDPSTSRIEEPSREDDAKDVTMTASEKSPLPTSHQGAYEDFEKESLAIAPSAGPIHEPSSQEDSSATTDKALACVEPQVASQSMEEPSSFVPSVDFEESAENEDVVKSDILSDGANSPLASSFEEPQEDSLANTSSRESTQGLAIEEDSYVTPTSAESKEVSKSVEEPSTPISSANFEKPAHEDLVAKSVAMTDVGMSPFTSSFEGPQEDFEKESIASTPSTKLAQELPTQEDSDVTPSNSQVASKFVEEPSTTKVPSANVESPLVSVLEEHKEDYTKESLVGGASVEVLEPTEEFFKESPETSIEHEETVQEKSGIVLPSAESTLTSALEESNHAAKETKYKLEEDFKVHHEHIKSIENEFPRSQSNLARVGSDKLKLESLATEGSDDHLESDESGEEFFDALHGNGNLEPLEFDEPKPFEESDVGPGEPGEATGINAVAQKEALVPASSVEPAQKPKQAPATELAQELGQAFESAEQASTQEHKHSQVEPEQRPAQERGQEPEQEHGQELKQEPAQELGPKPEQQPAQESEQEDLTRNSAMALPASDSQVTSTSEESQELLAEESLAATSSTKFEEPAQANTAKENGTRDLPLTSTTEEPQIDTVVSPEKSLSSASFCESGNPELLENLEQKPSDTAGSSSTRHEALESEPSTTAPTTEIAQGHDSRKSENIHISLEPELEESKEALVNEPVKAVPSTKPIEPAQEVGDGQSGAILASSEPQLTPTLQEPNEGFVEEPLVDAESAPKSIHFVESVADVPNKISAELVEELPLTSIAEEPQDGSVSSLVEGKHGQDEANQKFLEDVKIIAKPIKEAIPRTQSDLTHVKLNLEATEDAPKLQSQGSFLTFGATPLDSKEALVKEPLPSTNLLELFEEENSSAKKGHMLTDSPVASTVEEPQKVLAKELLATAKSVPKGHARWRGFARSSSEPQFASKLEEHQKALVKESLVVVVPSTSRLGEEHAQEDLASTQCLPFRILGEGKHPWKESSSKLVEDVKSPTTKFETTSSPYVLEPKPSKIKEIKEKKKKEKKEKKPSTTIEEKERRLSLGSGEMERKSSLRVEEKDSKHSPQSEEKHKQSFKHLRERLRHAFSINKEP